MRKATEEERRLLNEANKAQKAAIQQMQQHRCEKNEVALELATQHLEGVIADLEQCGLRVEPRAGKPTIINE